MGSIDKDDQSLQVNTRQHSVTGSLAGSPIRDKRQQKEKMGTALHGNATNDSQGALKIIGETPHGASASVGKHHAVDELRVGAHSMA